MGYLVYGTSEKFEFDDETLTNLRTVIITKFLQQESFIFTWTDQDCQRSLWLNPSQTLSFSFTGAEVPAIRRERVNELLNSANSPSGLRL